MMDEAFRYSNTRRAYVLSGVNVDQKYRVVIPVEFADDEIGGTPTEDQRLDWLRANLPEILQAYTARISGGRVKDPWGRVIVEEIDYCPPKF